MDNRAMTTTEPAHTSPDGTWRYFHSEPPVGLDETSRRVSRVLTEARTVHKRAATALTTIRAGMPYRDEAAEGHTESYVEHHYGDDGYATVSDVWTWRDPDADAIEAALEQIVALLAPFERKGRPSPGRGER